LLAAARAVFRTNPKECLPMRASARKKISFIWRAAESTATSQPVVHGTTNRASVGGRHDRRGVARHDQIGRGRTSGVPYGRRKARKSRLHWLNLTLLQSVVVPYATPFGHRSNEPKLLMLLALKSKPNPEVRVWEVDPRGMTLGMREIGAITYLWLLPNKLPTRYRGTS
jgi:hypothetical protein